MANIGYIQVNRYCNNQCHFCSNPSNGNNITYERGIELLDDFKKKNYYWVIFTWGEPTLSPDLYKWIQYSKKIWLWNRMISNWMQCSDYKFTKKLADSWLELVHFSVYSLHAKVHDFLTDTPWSWKKLMMSITNALNCWVRVQINTVINHYNETHLDKTVEFLSKTFPPVTHYVWNNLDPEMMRKTDTAWSTIPNFDNFKPSLNKAMGYLDSIWSTYRVEKMPLCYIRWHEWSSTETRKMVKNEERIIHFLDSREEIHEIDFEHEKVDECKKCDLNSICSWVYEKEKFFKDVKVYPQTLTDNEKNEIIKKIRQ